MPRSRGGASRPSAPSRASAPLRPSAPVPAQAPQHNRPMSTTTQQARPPAQTSQGPGLFGQMASTAAGVAVGSSIGHAVGGWFGGGSSASQAPEYSQPAQDNYTQPGQQMDSGLYNSQANSGYDAQAQGPCAGDIKSFTTCMEQNRGDMNICGWYLEQLKACQAAAGRY